MSREIMARLGALVGVDMTAAFAAERVEVLRTDTETIELPEGMSFDTAIEWLKRKKQDEEQAIELSHTIDALPLEGGLALRRALEERFGWVASDHRMVETFFGPVKAKPIVLSVKVSAHKSEPVPWGAMEIPGYEGHLQCEVGILKGRPVCAVRGACKRKDEGLFRALLDRADEIVRTESIYRGKALRVVFPDLRETLSPDDFSPEFMDLTDVDSAQVVFPERVGAQIRASLFAPIEYAEVCRRNRIPLKRGVLMHGPYGTGKTLTAKIAAKKCQENGWTFLYVQNVVNLPQAVEFARRYQPCMVFAEDVDSVLGGDRDAYTNMILNTIDGIDGKTSEIMVVLTSNHVEDIQKAMLRPGRLDAVIRMELPDSGTAISLVRKYTGTGLTIADLHPVGEVLSGKQPAVIREACERAKLAAIAAGGNPQQLTVADLIVSAEGMAEQVRLLEEEDEDEEESVRIGKAIGSLVHWAEESGY